MAVDAAGSQSFAGLAAAGGNWLRVGGWGPGEPLGGGGCVRGWLDVVGLRGIVCRQVDGDVCVYVQYVCVCV